MSTLLRRVRLKSCLNETYFGKNDNRKAKLISVPLLKNAPAYTCICTKRDFSSKQRSQVLNNGHVHMFGELQYRVNHPVIAWLPMVRHNSSNADIASNVVSKATEYIPPPPSVPPPEAVTHTLNALGEPTFESLGLGGYWPSGLIQSLVEYIHVDVGLSWFTTIVLTSVAVRVALFPVMINMQKKMPQRMKNVPKMQKIQEKLTLAKIEGNTIEASKLNYEMAILFKQDFGLTTFTPIIQGLTVVSVFFALRQMASLPVESMKTGGLFWFTDLTVSDPTFILPAMSVVAAFITLELGIDGISTQTMQKFKWVIRVLPLVSFPILMNFPAALLTYWVSASTVGVFQVSLLKIPAVRKYLGLGDRKALAANLEAQQKQSVGGFYARMKRSSTNKKILHKIENRHRNDAEMFRKAGQGPIQKTYSYDPTKVKKSEAVTNK